MFDPQTMSDYEARDLRNKAFHLLKLYTSFTFLDHGRQAYQDFLDAFARQLNDPGLIPTDPDPDTRRWVQASLANGTYEADYRRFLEEMIPIEEGLKLLRTKPYKEEAYRSILNNRFTADLGGRGADERSLDHDPFYRALGYYQFPRIGPSKEFLSVQIAEEEFEVLSRSLFGKPRWLQDNSRVTYHWTYESFFESEDNSGRGWPPISYPPVLPFCLPPNTSPDGQIWSGEEIPVTGIWEPWFIEEPVKAGVLSGLVDKLTGKPPANEEPIFTGKVGCPNYFLAGTTAFEYEMEGSDRKVKVAWRLIWEDTRYLDGTIPEEENGYFATALTAPPPTVLTAYPGDPCPEAGEWYSVNWNDRRALLQKGDPMPGPKHSATGAVIWHRKK